MHNAHMYYVLLESANMPKTIQMLKELGVYAVFHYVPLHLSPAGMRYSKSSGELPVTNKQAGRLVRLPLWVGLNEEQQAYVVDCLEKCLRSWD